MPQQKPHSLEFIITGHCNNCCYLGHAKNLNDGDDDDDASCQIVGMSHEGGWSSGWALGTHSSWSSFCV